MPSRQSRQAISLSYTDAVSLLMKACGFDPEVRSAFDARVRQLQRLGLPARPDARSHARYPYGITELAALATAIKLMSAFLLPTLAVRQVNERWPELTTFLLSGVGDAAPAGYWRDRPPSGGRYAVFEGAGLAELGARAAHEARYVGPLGRLTLFEDCDLAAASRAAAGAGVLIDAGSYMSILVEEVGRVPLATADDISAELDRLRFSGLAANTTPIKDG